jgi:hypothetical protein
MNSLNVHALEGGHRMPPLPEAIILVLAPVAPLFLRRVWRHAQLWLLDAILAPGARTVTAALRAMGLATERPFTHDHRVLNRATGSTRPGSRMLLGGLITWLVPPGATIVLGVVAAPEGTLRLEASFWTDLHATPAPSLRWVVMRWAVEVTGEAARTHLGVATQRQWSEQALTPTTPVRLALCSRVTVLTLRLSHGGQLPVPVTAWDHTAEPTFSAGLTRVRWHLWRAQYVVTSTPEAESMQCPQGVLDRLLNGLPLAA